MDTTENSRDFPFTLDRCQCTYCIEHWLLFQIIMAHNPKWLTISPPASDKDPTEHYIDWLEDIMELLKCSKYILGVVEFKNCRMHFHIMYDCSDAIKSYRLINKFRIHAMVRIYDGGPKEGLHYLFKDIKDAQALIPNMSCVFTQEMLTEFRDELRRSRKERLKTAQTKTRIESIPEWMLKQ